ncbi:MAG: hypothetical protein CMF57_00155 [Leifsonia sp.]|nr:hypothetical protein [Leifsonia sp.]MBR20855.1 hypothetical protein [Leifsonia sp.]
MAGLDFTSYAAVLRIPGALAFSLAGWLGRFPRSTMSLGIILLVSTTTGSFGAAGSVAAALAIGMAVSGPSWSRLMDRHGQRGVLALALLCLLMSTTLLTVLVLTGAPLPTWVGAALLIGLSSADSAAAARARWAAVTDGDRRMTAFSIETLLDQSIFVLGPPVITVLAAVVSPLAGIGIAVAIGTSGIVALILQHDSEPPRHRRQESARRSILPPAAILPVALGAMGIGSFDVAIVGWADAQETEWLAGAAMAAMAAATGVGTLLMSARVWGISPRARYVAFAALTAATAFLMPATTGSWLLFVAVSVCGFTLGPVLVLGFTLVGMRAPHGRVTEVLAYPSAGTSVGFPIGATLAGMATDAQGAAAGMLVSACSAAFVLLVGGGGELLLRARERRAVSAIA